MSRTVYLDARKLVQPQEAHAYLSEMLSLPDYYGRNLDGLYDCLAEVKECRVILLYHTEADLSGTYGEKIINVFTDIQKENPGFTVKIE